MPNPPYGPDTDRTEIFEESGAAILLELGRLLCSLERARGCRLGKQGTEADGLREQVVRKQEEIVGYFDLRPKAAMRKYVSMRAGKAVDPRACRIVGYLGARMVFDNQDSVPIMRAARDVSLTDSPAEVLESRRAIASLGSHGIVEAAKLDGLYHAGVRLSPEVMLPLLGGGRCLPVVNQDAFQEVSDDRRRRLSHSVNKPKRKATTRTGIAGFVESIPLATPKEICRGLEERGYVGQEGAKRAVALAAYRHVMRLRQIHLKGIARDELPAQANVLCIGSTGVGKSFLMRLLFGEELMLPTAAIDLCAYSETGYVGNEVSSIPTHLLLDAGGDVEKAQCGIVVLDEADKLAEDGSGSGTRVSRQGVQRSLLKLLDPGSVEVPADLNGYHFRRRMVPFRTDDVLWVACGAFSGLKAAGASTGRIGFSDAAGGHVDGRDADLTASDFESYGLLPELMGRFHQWVAFDALGREQLSEILRRNGIEQRRRELKAHGISLAVEDSASELIVDRAMERGTGARGIEAELAGALEEASFEAYSSPGKAKEITVSARNGELAWDLSLKRKKKPAEPMTMDDLKDMVGDLVADG